MDMKLFTDLKRLVQVSAYRYRCVRNRDCDDELHELRADVARYELPGKNVECCFRVLLPMLNMFVNGGALKDARAA